MIFMSLIALFYRTPKILLIVILGLNLFYLFYIIAIIPFRRIYILVETIIVEGVANVSIL